MSQSNINPSQIPLQHLYQLLQPITVSPTSPNAKFSNWAHTYHATPLAVFEPETDFQCELVLELARRESKVVRAAGVGHSPSDLACTNEYMLRTGKLKKLLEINVEKRYVIAQPGITLQDLHVELAKRNLAMMNVGSISDQTLAGVITTATHGTGIAYGVISTHVMAMTLLLADGSRVSCSRHERPDLFSASLCGLGATGFILSIQLEVEPAFRLEELQESLPFEEVMQNLDNIVHSAQHVRFWWYPVTDIIRCSYFDRTQEPKRPVRDSWYQRFLGYHVTQFLLFVARYFLFLNEWVARYSCWLVSAPTLGVNDSPLIFNIDCKYLQHTTEWAIPYCHTQACLRDIRAWLAEENSIPDGIRPHVPVEIRFSAADDIWLSPSNGRQTCWLGIVQYKPYGFNVPYRRYFEGCEKIMSRYQGRPHWAKAHGLRPDELRTLYPRFEDFVHVLRQYDPHGMFHNEYIQRHILGRPISRRVFKSRPI